jgi:hypothetical protein
MVFSRQAAFFGGAAPRLGQILQRSNHSVPNWTLRVPLAQGSCHVGHCDDMTGLGRGRRRQFCLRNNFQGRLPDSLTRYLP